MRIVKKYLKGGPKLEPEQEWILNWYANRMPLLMANYLEALMKDSDWGEQLNNLKTVKYYKNPQTLPKNILMELSAKELNVYNTEGMYLPEHHIMYTNSPLPGHSIKIHEFTHSLKPEIQKAVILKHLHHPNYDDFSPYTLPYHLYLDDPDEVNSRVMEFRYNNNLDPRKKYTIDEIRRMKPNGDGIEWENGRPTDLLDRYDDETLLFLINDLASNKNKNENSKKV